MERHSRRDREVNPRRPPPFITLWMIVGALVFACVLLTITFGSLMIGRSHEASVQSTAILRIILAATSTPTGDASAGATPGNPEQPVPTQLPGEITSGAYVQVTGTGGNGLRLRDQPGLEATVRMVASESEVFKVDDGPVELDGYTWWHLIGPFDESRQGWAVANFLGIDPNP